MLMQFVALTFLLISEALHRREPRPARRWLAAASAAAGIAFGCKLTGLFVIIPVLTASVVHPSLSRGLRGRVAMAASIVGIFALSFFLTTPGSLLDPVRFAAAVIYEADSYNNSPVLPFLVAGPANYLWLMAVWLFAVVPSSAMALALAMSSVTALGLHTLWWRQPALFWCFAAYVVPLIGFFLTSTHILLVRNALVFVPLTAVAFGAGAYALYEWARVRKAGVLAPIAIAAAVLYNIGWLWIAAFSIYRSDTASYAGRLLDYIEARPNQDFRLSPAAVAMLKAPPRLFCADGAGAPASAASRVVFLAKEREWDQWLANRAHFFDASIASLEINYDYYPSWYGRTFAQRIEILGAENARAMHVDFANFQSCRARPDRSQ